MFSGYVLVHYIVRIQYNGVTIWTNGLGLISPNQPPPPKKKKISCDDNLVLPGLVDPLILTSKTLLIFQPRPTTTVGPLSHLAT